MSTSKQEINLDKQLDNSIKNTGGKRITNLNYTVIDLEMTGLSAKSDKVIEVGAVRVRDGKIVDTVGYLINPRMTIPPKVVELTGITDKDLIERGLDEDQGIERLIDFIGDDIIVGHNVIFDYSFLKQWAVNKKISLEYSAVDTLKIARIFLSGDMSKKLENLCEYYGIHRENAHRALDDSIETMQLYEKLEEEAYQAYLSGKVTFDQYEKILSPKKLLYKAKRQTPATKHQIEKLKEYRMKHGITEDINYELLSRSQASRIMDKYFSIYGR